MSYIKKVGETKLSFLQKVAASKVKDYANVFVYGTLMDDRLWRLLMRGYAELDAVSAVLPGFQAIQVDTEDGPDYRTLIVNKDDLVKGKLYRVKTPQGLERLDLWEDQYERRQVRLGNGQTAWTYCLKKARLKDLGRSGSFELSPEELAEEQQWVREFGRDYREKVAK